MACQVIIGYLKIIISIRGWMLIISPFRHFTGNREGTSEEAKNSFRN